VPFHSAFVFICNKNPPGFSTPYSLFPPFPPLLPPSSITLLSATGGSPLFCAPRPGILFFFAHPTRAYHPENGPLEADFSWVPLAELAIPPAGRPRFRLLGLVFVCFISLATFLRLAHYRALSDLVHDCCKRLLEFLFTFFCG